MVPTRTGTCQEIVVVVTIPMERMTIPFKPFFNGYCTSSEPLFQRWIPTLLKV